MKKSIALKKVGLTIIFGSLLCVVVTKSLQSQEEAQMPNQGKNTIPVEVQFMAAGIRDARERAKCIQVEFTHTYYRSKEFVQFQNSKEEGFPEQLRISRPVQAIETTNAGIVNYKRPQLSIEFNSYTNASKIVSNSLLYADGKEAKTLDRQTYTDLSGQSNSTLSGVRVMQNEVVYNGVWRLYSNSDPRTYTYYAGGRPLDTILLNPKAAPTFVGEQIVDGSRWMGVKLSESKTAHALLWIDVDHSFLLRKLSRYSSVNGKDVLTYEIDVPSLLESKDFWFPSTIETKQFWMDFGEISHVGSEAPIINRINVSTFKSDCNIPSETFQLKWPVGTSVSDVVNQEQLRVMAVEKPDLFTFNTQREQKKRSPRLSTEIEERELAEVNAESIKQGKPKLNNPVAVAIDQDDLIALRKIKAARAKLQ